MRSGDKWKHHRRLVSPSFNYNVVTGYLPVFNKNCKGMVDTLRLKVGQPTFNVREIIVHTTLDLFLEATFGSEMTDTDKVLFREYMAEYKISCRFFFVLMCKIGFCRGMKLITLRIFSPWYHFEWIWKLTNYPKRLKCFRLFAKTLITNVRTCHFHEFSNYITNVRIASRG